MLLSALPVCPVCHPQAIIRCALSPPAAGKPDLYLPLNISPSVQRKTLVGMGYWFLTHILKLFTLDNRFLKHILKLFTLDNMIGIQLIKYMYVAFAILPSGNILFNLSSHSHDKHLSSQSPYPLKFFHVLTVR